MNTRHNSVHKLIKSEDDLGLEVNLNWRYWGIDFSWGDCVRLFEPDDLESWFIGFRIGPVYVTYAWLK